MAQTVFQRYEKKYLLDREQYTALRDQLSGRMREDRYGRYTICNIYYDTPDYQLIRASLEKPVYKEKLRLRSYRVPDSQSPVFLELKKKFDGVVYKRRAVLTQGEAQRFLWDEERPDGQEQILNEIGWAMQFYRPEPKVFIGYDRTALFSEEEPDLRVTFDTRLRWRNTALDLSKGDWGAPIRRDGKILMELKLPGAMPLWMAHLLGDLRVYPTSFSKYGACYQQYLYRQQRLRGGAVCA